MDHNHTACSITTALYPSYLEGLASPASKDFVEAHLGECPDCQRLLHVPGHVSHTPAHVPNISGNASACTANLSEASYLKHYRRLFFASTLGVFLGILLFALLFTNMAFGMKRFFKVVTRQQATQTDSSSDYHHWEDYQGISDFAIFSADLSACKSVNKYYYQCSSSSFLTSLQLYLDCTYTPEDYEAEKQRLLSVAQTDGEQSLFAQPACYTMLFYDTSCEYAIFLEDEQRILYISLQNIPRDEIAFDEAYLPLDYGNFGSPPENQAEPYCIYQKGDYYAPENFEQ